MSSGDAGRPKQPGGTMTTTRKLFLNLAVGDLKRSIAFFKKLGFTFNPKFTNDKGACMVVSEEAFVMLLSEPFFQGFTKKKLCDTASQNEALIAISAESRGQVDTLVNTAIAEGGKPALDKQDHAFMYAWSFYDLDGHHWEVVWMDPKAA
jgi:predicted lactoylglutathione lyase